uniref:No apical meristem-associated C-terminal domain-containing protein n=2 Tax=Oryza punctata TaxID=4537 RepID=A0A0E0KA25_ORYPU
MPMEDGMSNQPDENVSMANLNAYHLATWADSAKTRNPTGPGSSHENMWLHVENDSNKIQLKRMLEEDRIMTMAISSKPLSQQRFYNSFQDEIIASRMNSSGLKQMAMY